MVKRVRDDKAEWRWAAEVMYDISQKLGKASFYILMNEDNPFFILLEKN